MCCQRKVKKGVNESCVVTKKSQGRADYMKNTVQEEEEEKVSRKKVFSFLLYLFFFQSVFSCPLINRQKTEK